MCGLFLSCTQLMQCRLEPVFGDINVSFSIPRLRVACESTWELEFFIVQVQGVTGW